MSVSSTVSNDGREVQIRINGRFDFSTHREFRDAYSRIDPAKARYRIDLGDTNYMDSSALGMLLVLRERAGGDLSDITICGCSATILQILEVSRFEHLFKIA